MRWLGLVLFCAVLLTTYADPEPKKYKSEVKSKDKLSNTSLTDEERKFLREVEAKFGIKTDVPVEKNDDDDEEKEVKPTNSGNIKLPFPAVIAIEIVNDTDTKSKGKRTIDANLGYGYKTNNGYAYTYFGKDKGKFMIYPYSQHDIPSAHSNTHNSHSTGESQHSDTKSSAEVEITPSQAYELVPTKEEDNSYHYEKPGINFDTKYESVQAPPPPYPTNPTSQQTSYPSTLYTTYNGEHFSSLSGQFPSVMSNYLVDSTQLLKNPQYQSAGLTQDYLRSHGAQSEQRVIPVLVLRIPSSYLKNPTAELYANLPQNYPLSQYLNSANLQELVNQYFKKIGYSYAPQVTAYQNSPLTAPVEATISTPVTHHQEPQQYASPYIQPTYTHTDYSGVQYSAVQPVMAKYPSGYTRQQYYLTRGQSLYRQPIQQQYVYRYRYVPQSTAQTYYQPQYQQLAYQLSSQQAQSGHDVSEQQTTVQDGRAHADYGSQQQTTSDEAHLTSVELKTEQPETGHGYEYASVTPNLESVATATPQYEDVTPERGPTKVPIPVYSPQTPQLQYEQHVQQDTVSVYPRSQAGHRYNLHSQPGISQTYVYQNQVNSDSDNHGLVLSENYPSKDHTIATVLPLSYKSRKQYSEPVQSVSYVTPVPHSMKYQSQYRVMVPQTIFRNPTPEKVSYVNSHSLPASYGPLGTRDYNPEEEHTAGPHYIPPISRQKPPLYPRNYHSYPKRMVIKSDSKLDNVSLSRKPNERKKLA